MKTQNLIWIGFLTIFFNSCVSYEKADKIITNSRLLTCLTDVIAHEDSLTKSISTYGVIKSFKVTFIEEDNKCFVLFEGDFDYYDSNAMNGYFWYKNKAISVYSINANCGNNFIDKNKLIKGKIKGLKDFDQEKFENAIKLNLPPPPPPPPREPYYRKYLILNKDNFQIVDDYDFHIIRTR